MTTRSPDQTASPPPIAPAGLRQARRQGVRVLRRQADRALAALRGGDPLGPSLTQGLARDMARHAKTFCEDRELADAQARPCEAAGAAREFRRLAEAATGAAPGADAQALLHQGADRFFDAEARDFAALARTLPRSALAAWTGRLAALACLGLALLVVYGQARDWLRDYRASQVRIDLFAPPPPGETVQTQGLGDVEGGGGPRPYRWGLGPQSRVSFRALERQLAVLVCVFDNPSLDEQGVTLFVNDRPAARCEGLPKGQGTIAWRTPIVLARGVNSLRLVYDRWNHRDGEAFSPEDSRTFAVRVLTFQVLPDALPANSLFLARTALCDPWPQAMAPSP